VLPLAPQGASLRAMRTIPSLTILAALALAACAPQPVPQSAAAAAADAKRSDASAEWTRFVEQFVERYFAQHPSFAVVQGRHEFDGRMPDWAPAALQKEQAWLEQSRSQALGFSALGEGERFQRDYLLSRIDAELFWLRDVRAPFTNPTYYFDSGLDPSTYVNTPYAPVEQRMKAFIAYAQKVPAALTQLRANLQLPLPKSFADYSAVGFKGFAQFYRDDVPRAFEAAKDPELNQQLTAALEPAAKAMQELGEWFSAQTQFNERGYVLGPERFRAMLQASEAVNTPLDKLEAIGRADLTRNLDALNAACKRYAAGASIQACVEKMNGDKPSGGAVEGARQQLAQLREFILQHEIVSIPGSEEAKVAEAPAYRRQNFAYIEIPGPYEKNLPSVYYIAPPDTRWSKAEQDAYIPGKADLLFTSVHEVWPGHFLQFLHSNRASWRFGQLFVGYAFAEGWAHYAEELMIEESMAKDAPELQIGQLLNALLRNVRFLCAIGLHTQDMTVGQCEQLFKDKAYQDAGNARQQAARGTYDPGYLNYTMGKLMIRKLRSDWQAENPGKPRREFHDALLSHGGPPIPLLRAQLLKQSGGELF
jgi:uncharacterized protein (DUF885 family)